MNFYNKGLEDEKAHKMFSHVFGGESPPLASLGNFALDLYNNYENRQIFSDEDAKYLFSFEGPKEIAKQDNESGRTMSYDDDPLLSSASHASSMIQHQYYGTRNRWDARGYKNGYNEYNLDYTSLQQPIPQIASELESKGMKEFLLQKRQLTPSLEPANDALRSEVVNGAALSHKRFVNDLLPLKKNVPAAPSGWWDSMGNHSYMAEEQETRFDGLHRQVQPLGSAFSR